MLGTKSVKYFEGNLDQTGTALLSTGAAACAWVLTCCSTEARSTEAFQGHLLFTPCQTKILTQLSFQLTALVCLSPPSLLCDLDRGP